MAPTKVDLIDHYKGDTWVGMSIGPVLFNGVQPLVNLASVKIQFRDADDVLGYELNTTGGAGIGDITIDDPVTWEITVPKQDLPLDAGDFKSEMKNKKYWYYDLETIDIDGTKLTIYKGRIKVFEDVTG